jgi:hypothetical protein
MLFGAALFWAAFGTLRFQNVLTKFAGSFAQGVFCFLWKIPPKRQTGRHRPGFFVPSGTISRCFLPPVWFISMTITMMMRKYPFLPGVLIKINIHEKQDLPEIFFLLLNTPKIDLFISRYPRWTV